MGTEVDLDNSITPTEALELANKAQQANRLRGRITELKGLRFGIVTFSGVFLGTSLEGGPNAKARAAVSAGTLILVNLMEKYRISLEEPARQAETANYIVTAVQQDTAYGQFPRNGEGVG